MHANIGAPKYIKQLLTNLKAEIDSNARVENFNNLLSTMDRSSRQKINKEIMDLNYTLSQMYLTNIQNIPSNSSRKHILLKHTQNILQDRSYVGSQN